MANIALNADVGEGLESDLILFPYLQQASIACGGHTGNQHTMQQAVRSCLEHRVSIGAHPSYPDKENFGRLSQNLAASDLTEQIGKQISALHQVCEELGATLAYVKPHGALYNDMMADVDVFNAVVTAVHDYPLPLKLMIGAMPNTANYRQLAADRNVTIIAEAFADRRYHANGQLLSRAKAGAVFDSPSDIFEQFKSIVEHQEVISESGEPLAIEAQSICLHGDNPASVQAVSMIAEYLAQRPTVKAS